MSKKTTKLNFFTEPVRTTTGLKYYGLCKQLSAVKYGPKTNRDTALSGAKRQARNLTAKGGFTPPTGPSKVSPAFFGAPLQPIGQPTKRKVNRICLVIDRSGSMGHLTAASVKALNDNIETIRAQARATGQTTLVTVLSFDDTISAIRQSTNVEVIEPIRVTEVGARGQTALFDAVGEAIKGLQGAFTFPDEDSSYLIMAITDGQENSSRNFTAASLRSCMQTVISTDRWTLTFLLPPGAKNHFVSQFGISEGNVAEWEGTTQGVQAYTQQNTQGIGTYFSSRSVGVNSVKSFYTDLSGLTSKQVKTQLDDLSNQVRILPVDREQDIRTFVQDKLGVYTPGSAFYQLTKDEKEVQSYKQLLVMEKGKRQVYGGADARQVLGIPPGNLKVKPGNHGNFDIFVQSTSLNRKLVRGTKLLVQTSGIPPLLRNTRSNQAYARKRY